MMVLTKIIAIGVTAAFAVGVVLLGTDYATPDSVPPTPGVEQSESTVQAWSFENKNRKNKKKGVGRHGRVGGGRW